MTEYELHDALTNTSLASIETFGIHITLMVAYLVTSYAAGKHLSSAQALTISLLFVVAGLTSRRKAASE